jgi:DNA-binding CsgD family transcriptional regulator/tetratricopeptide (TPR) repeat protein
VTEEAIGVAGSAASSATAAVEAATGFDRAGLRVVEDGALDPSLQPQCSLAVQLRRATGSIVGRAVELTAIRQVLGDAATHLSALTLEGEPGIGKTRLLLAAAEQATAAGFTAVAVTADEEIRGPFLVARSLFAASALRDTAATAAEGSGPAAGAGTRAIGALQRVGDAIAGRDEPGFATLSPDARQLRAYDLAGVAVGALAEIRPLALLIDDVQWADDDSLRLLRYVVRSVADRPIFLFLTVRPDEFATVPEAVNFVADMERMGIVRRIRPGRFTQIETAELLKQVLGGPVEGPSVAAMHAQSEGVPFIIEELARTHREAGTLQQLDGEWRLGRNAARLVPSAVRTLISRRAARLPAPTRAALADAALLGRSFSLRDVRAIRSRLEAAETDLSADLQPAVEAGLLLPQPEGAAADFTFTHEQVREFAANELSGSRRRQVHGAIVDMLLEGGEPSPAALPMLARHALAAGDTERSARLSIQAAAAALKANAPEESLRLVDQALPVVSAPADRRVLLLTRDDAYALLRRPDDRVQGLAELASLAEALGDRPLELDVMLRRAAALRMADDVDSAAELARRVRTRAAELGEREAELRACLELGQASLGVTLGEGYFITPVEGDLDAGDEAYRRAVELAEELGDERSLAAATRELGTVAASRVRVLFVDEAASGRALGYAGRLAAGEPIESILDDMPAIAERAKEANGLFERALAIYERLGDRTGVMSTVIAMAYLAYAPLVHLTSSARHLEEIKRVIARSESMVTESERARQELQLLYGIHVYARAKVVPDLALTRGEEAYRAARLLGDQATQFLAAGGVAMAHLDLGEVDEAGAWVDRAADVAAAAPTSIRSRQLETWRGRVRAAAGDAAGMRRHLEQALAIATAQGKAAARCETLARLALEAARLGARTDDGALLELAERSANEARTLCGMLPGHPHWGPQADAALATVAMARGDVGAAVAAAGMAIGAVMESHTEDLDLDILLPAARALNAGGPEDAQAAARGFLQLSLARIAQGTVDESIRVRWLRGPVGRELVEVAGTAVSEGPVKTAGATGVDLDDVDRRLLALLTQGHTNAEMAADLGFSETDLAPRLAGLLARLGASSRAEATSLAFRGLAPVGARPTPTPAAAVEA